MPPTLAGSPFADDWLCDCEGRRQRGAEAAGRHRLRPRHRQGKLGLAQPVSVQLKPVMMHGQPLLCQRRSTACHHASSRQSSTSLPTLRHTTWLQIRGGEMVPFMFTVKNLNIEGKADGLTGDFTVPSYRECCMRQTELAC